MEKAYLDTNVFIYAFEGDPKQWGHLQSFFEFGNSNKGIFTTSELTNRLPPGTAHIDPTANGIRDLMERLSA